MKETILLAPGANGTELMRTLARFGKNSLGLRVMNATELSKFALMRSGIIIENDFLPRKQESAIIDSFIRNITYFKSASFADSEKIAAALFSLRSLISENEFETIHTVLKNGEFKEKNTSLIAVFDQYMSTLKTENMIDTIGLIRKAVSEAKVLDCDFYTLKEFPLSPVEKTLITKVATNYKTVSLPELFEKGTTEFKNIDYSKSYGSSNEVEAVFDYIIKNNIPFDKCTIATPSLEKYSQLFYEFSLSHDINITFGCGLPILNSNPARLLKLLFDWNTVGYNGIDSLSKLLQNDAFDKKKLFNVLNIDSNKELNNIIEIAGALRICCDSKINNERISDYKSTLSKESSAVKILPAIEILADELSKGESKIIEKYSVIREGFAGRIDRSALSVVCDSLDAYMRFSGSDSPNQIIPEILKKSVCSENSRDSALFVTGIGGALSSLRENLFIVGLSSSNFPGTPKENYLLLDSDYLLLGDENTVPISSNCVNKNKESLDNLLYFASALDVNIHISYSSYNLSDLKEENPSSALFEIFKKQYGESVALKDFTDSLKHIGYFGQNISNARLIGEAFNNGKDILYNEKIYDDTPDKAKLDIPFSPTAIDDFFSCPRHFFLTKILGVKEPEEDDPFEVISPVAIGSLVHSLMEDLAHNTFSEEEFLKLADTAFEKFLKSRPPIHSDSAKTEKAKFIRIMKNAYRSDPKNEVLASEENKTVKHSSGVLLRGIPDRVEKSKNGEYIIADYKTGRKINHKPHDIDTCLQVVIYAYLLEQSGIPISYCEYRYLRDAQIIRCNYDNDMKEKLNQKLLQFKYALDTGVFPVSESADSCRYCKLKNICDRTAEMIKEEEVN